MLSYKIYSTLQNDDFCFVYLDHFSDDITEFLLSIQENRVDESKKVKKTLTYLLTECFQNIIRHTNDQDIDQIEDAKALAVRFIKGNHYLITSNPVAKSNEENLSNTLNKLNDLTEEELKSLYLETMNVGCHNEKGGAGLGLIEMARKSKNPVSFCFSYLNDTYSNFYSQIKVAGTNLVEDSTFDVKQNVFFHKFLLAHDIILLQKSEFNQTTIMTLFKMIEKADFMNSVAQNNLKKSMYILVEMLQNMSRYAELINGIKSGIFIITRDRATNKLNIHTGNYIKNTRAEVLMPYLASLLNLDSIELSKKYKALLKNEQPGISQESGLGLIELFRQTDSNVVFHLEPIDSEFSFISFKVPF